MLSGVLARRALSGFFVSGLLFAFLGAILPAWGYHIEADYITVGNYFLGLNLGLLVSARTAQFLLARKGIRPVLVWASALGCAAFLFLAMAPPGSGPLWKVVGVFLVGLSAGGVNTTVFRAITPIYQHEPAATVNLAGAFFGLGCLVTSLLVAGAFYVYTVPSILIFLGLIPAFFAGIYAKAGYESIPPPPRPTWRQAFEDFKSPGALLFSLLLFIQFGNEWSVAGWLTLFLIQRLGVSPETSLNMLAMYWFTLLVARTAFQWLLPRVRHGRLLFASGLSTVFGCSILLFTNNLFGAGVGILLLSAGFAAVYPLVVEKIGDRFPYYHPGLFNGIFSLAMTGGLLAPWTLGFYAKWWGIRVVMLLPLIGACAVFLLLVLIWGYAKLTASPRVTEGAE